ncbi:unnamed protein product [Dovyalis caffra]|uniref:Uncharacterized protein n=1 Tax=Dovyalis caffra TaxID=77055 RepID=A0AAV1RDG6_9ROSI|nr:unnamed protein product [Dovyalis caffra]
METLSKAISTKRRISSLPELGTNEASHNSKNTFMVPDSLSQKTNERRKGLIKVYARLSSAMATR